MATFTYDGETFSFVDDPARIPLGLLDQIEQHYGGRDFLEVFRESSRLRRILILVWAGIAVRRPGFTLAEAEQLDLGLGDLVGAVKQPEPAPEDEPGVVLSPTSGGPAPKPKRGARSTGGSGAATRRPSRSTSASARGKSTS